MEKTSLEEMRRIARELFLRAVEAVDPFKRLTEMMRVEKGRLLVRTDGASDRAFDLDAVRRIFVAGTGKASAAMAQAVEEILGERVTGGVVTTKYGHGLPLKRIALVESGHPIPDLKGVEGARRIRDLLQGSGPDDLVIFLLSGGGSALLPYPADGIGLDEKQEATRLLIGCGAEIHEINCIRKHISQIKGGSLAKWASLSPSLCFILSDVVGDSLDVIASGPTVPDSSTFEQAWSILEKYDLVDRVAASIRLHLSLGREGKIPETPKPGDPAFERVVNILIGSNRIALGKAAALASSSGFNTSILSSSIVGETRESARFHAAIAREIVSSGNPLPRPACILSGGETTVTIKGRGLGGRNQEFALAAALEIEGLENVLCLSGGTDGTDGPTDAAGAMADGTTTRRARALGLNPRAYLKDNDAYPFFKSLGDLLITGPTRTNVMDVRILLVG
jgi:hydroxypyruvate reductase